MPKTETKKPTKKKAKPKTALVPVEPPAVPAEVPAAQQRLSLTDYKRNQKVLAQFVKEYLKEGEDGNGDFGTIKGCGPKKVLFKPGAEKLAELYHIGTKMICTKDEEDFTNTLFNYTYRCEVFPLANPELSIAQCEGSANSRERKLSGMPTNTVRKRAQKRAYVGAIIMATRSSQWFAHDLEEKGELADQNKGHDILCRQVWDMGAKAGGNRAQVLQWMKDRYGVEEKIEELGPAQLRHAIKLMKVKADARATRRGKKKGGKSAKQETA